MATRKKKTAKSNKQPSFKGHYCKICDTYKANEKFIGKGHSNHICKSCASKSPAKKSEDLTINKLHRMAYRFITKEEVKWLKNRMNDNRQDIRELAREIHNLKFPNYERNEIKKTLKITDLTFHIRGDIWDSYGDEYFVNVEFVADTNGRIIRKTYDQNNNILEEQTIEIGKSEIRKLFNVAVHEYNIFFWDKYLCEKISFDPDVDILPEFMNIDDDVDVFSDEEDEFDDIPDSEDEPVDESREFTWSVGVRYPKGAIQNTKGYDDIPDEVMNLFNEISDYFIDDELLDEEDFDDEEVF